MSEAEIFKVKIQTKFKIKLKTPYQSIRKALMTEAGTKIHAYLQMLHFPELLTDEQLRHVTGCDRESFEAILRDIASANPKEKERIFNLASEWCWTLEKLRMNPSFKYAGVGRNCSDTTLSDIFWKNILIYHFPCTL